MLEEVLSSEHDANTMQVTAATAMAFRMFLMFDFIDIKFMVVSKRKVRLLFFIS